MQVLHTRVYTQSVNQRTVGAPGINVFKGYLNKIRETIGRSGLIYGLICRALASPVGFL